MRKSILPLSGKEGAMEDHTINTDPIPVGIEELLAMAAVDSEFATTLFEDRSLAIKASGVTITDTEKSILSSIDNVNLGLMIKNVRGKIPAQERRAFLKKSAAALLALVGGGILASHVKAESIAGKGGMRADRGSPVSGGVRGDRPVMLRKNSPRIYTV